MRKQRNKRKKKKEKRKKKKKRKEKKRKMNGLVSWAVNGSISDIFNIFAKTRYLFVL